MASIALDDYDAPARPPLSVHPAFPAIVALWFSALLGLGSLVLPPVLIERLVVEAGIAAVVPAAAPPLGLTARALIALAGALAGAAIGFAIARRVASAHLPKPQSRIAKLAGAPRRPLSVKEELGGEKVINGQSLPINRRRALAISEDDRPSDFLYRAPLPGEDSETAAPFGAIGDYPADEEPLELSMLVEDEFDAKAAHDADITPNQDDAMTESHEFQPASSFERFAAPEAEAGPVNDIEEFKHRAGPRGLEPLPFAAPSFARRVPEPEPEEAQTFDAARPAFEPVEVDVVEPEGAADWETASLAELGLVQLVQRLGSTIERRRAWLGEAAEIATAAPDHPAPAEFEAAPAEEAAQAMAAYFGAASTEPRPFAKEAEVDSLETEPTVAARPPSGILRALQPFDDDEDDDAVPDFSLPLRRSAATTPATAAPDNDAGEEPVEEDEGESEAPDAGYSSLLGMRNPFAPPSNEFVRIDEPQAEPDLPEPAVVFPGQQRRESFAIPATANGQRLFDPPGKASEPAAHSAQPPRADADAALRAALATLQKMSSTA